VTDPITQCVSKTLWPFLRQEGFTKVTPRKFSRERRGVFQQLWIDANGFSGRARTYVILLVGFPFGGINSYYDPFGFRICDGRSWDMSTTESADSAMQRIVDALATSELARIDEVSGIDVMIPMLGLGTGWGLTARDQYRRWQVGDAEMLEVEAANRAKLKL
jgi:hypothetical protein